MDFMNLLSIFNSKRSRTTGYGSQIVIFVALPLPIKFGKKGHTKFCDADSELKRFSSLGFGGFYNLEHHLEAASAN